LPGDVGKHTSASSLQEAKNYHEELNGG
jgi:hypothetical protein